jgi:tRNA(Ile)-lysidine synthase
VAEVRTCVRRALGEFPPGALVLVACSGGADSLSLAAALAHEAPRRGLRGGGVTVDHGLQPGSAARAQAVAALLSALGLDPVEAVTVDAVDRDGHGPEAAARMARYAAMDGAVARTGAAAVLLGHSRDDQAETVLLGLARGAGSRSLAGMPASRGHYRRPLLDVGRETLRTACGALGLDPWEDPHNSDPSYTRSRVRHQVLPVLETALGPGVAEALARTARQLRADADVLDELAGVEAARVRAAANAWRADLLAALPTAIRTRVLHQAATEAGCPPGALSSRHVQALDALVSDWHGQRGPNLPGGIHAERRYGKLLFSRLEVSARTHEQAPPGGAN